ARPFVGREVIDRVLRAARKGAVVAAVPVRDTLKQTDGAGRVVRTLGRDGVWQAQTPQGFPRALILSTHERASRDGIRAGDDAGLCEHFGVSVLVVDGAPENLKITSAADLLLAEAVAHLAAHVQTSPRP
ncbi:MAG: 2-C-methyl-D-erythritol 4-phosphate cytidylyltransferase, partial [Gemmatimonadota bacterium]|nr:2-C-methyl-D-erythritol 4-phosphate cytidylyltransferase [Gemmatimonadota bacterium]